MRIFIKHTYLESTKRGSRPVQKVNDNDFFAVGCRHNGISKSEQSTLQHIYTPLHEGALEIEIRRPFLWCVCEYRAVDPPLSYARSLVLVHVFSFIFKGSIFTNS
jgi:hypothetical protein